MKNYESPKIEISEELTDIVTASDPVIVDRGYDLPGIPALLN